MRSCLEDEFNRLAKSGRDYLVLGELLGIKLPFSAWTLEPAHLASLFAADRYTYVGDGQNKVCGSCTLLGAVMAY